MKFALIFVALSSLSSAAWAGYVQGTVLPEKMVQVKSPVLQEVIADILVDEGLTVKEGDVLVQLRNDREKLDVQISEKAIELKSFIARGQQKLFQEQMGSEEKALEAKTDLELSRLQLAAKKVALDEKTIRAPLSGIVVKKYKERGESVDRMENLIDIIAIDRVLVQFYLTPDLRSAVQQDQKIKIKISDLNDAEVEGIITFVSPRNDPASGQLLIKVRVENKDHRIKPGMQGIALFGKP